MNTKNQSSSTPEEVKSRRHGKAVRKGLRNAAINLDDAIERAMAKDNN